MAPFSIEGASSKAGAVQWASDVRELIKRLPVTRAPAPPTVSPVAIPPGGSVGTQGSAATPAVSNRPLPWKAILVVGLLLAAAVGGGALYYNDQAEQATQVRKELEAKKRQLDEDAARAAAAASMADAKAASERRDAEQLEQKQRERALAQQSRDMAAAQDKAAREQAVRDRDRANKLASEQAARERAAKEQAQKEQAAKDQAAKEQAAKLEAAKSQAALDGVAKPPQPPATTTVRHVAFTGSLATSLRDYARANGIDTGTLTLQQAVPACDRWSQGFSKFDGSLFRVLCRSVPAEARQDLEGRHDKQSWMIFCSSKADAMPQTIDRSMVMKTCLRLY